MDICELDETLANCQNLAELFDLNTRLLALLLQRRVFTHPVLTKIVSEENEKLKKERLVSELYRLGAESFKNFYSVLRSTNQVEAAFFVKSRILQLEEQDRSYSSGEERNLELQLRHAEESKIAPGMYRMTSVPKGKCLIVNNVDFSSQEMAETDEKLLQVIFSKLGYEVIPECNSDEYEMMQILNDFAEDPEHERLDSCVVIILSNGKGADRNISNSYSSILDLFDNANCPYLKEKPKIFFFLTYQGKDCGVGKSLAWQTFQKDAILTDTLVAFAAVDGYVALCDDNGSWFCQELIHSLTQDALYTDLETVLKHVNSNIQKRKAGDGQRQSTEWTNYGFNYPLYFCDELTESVQHSRTTGTGPGMYRMSSRPRGRCLIINNVDFGGLKEYRKGAESEALQLKLVFQQLGYEVYIKCDQSAFQMLKVLNQFALDSIHQDMDSCIVAILSHGHTNYLLGVDGEKVYYSWVYNLFNSENCSSLKGKPKVFFFQACRGKRCDCGVSRNTASNGNALKKSQCIPVRTDMLVTYAAIDEHTPCAGVCNSLFCQELLSSLAKEAWNTDLETVLKHISTSIKQRMLQDGTMESMKWTNCGFNGTLYFNPCLR